MLLVRNQTGSRFGKGTYVAWRLSSLPHAPFFFPARHAADAQPLAILRQSRSCCSAF